MWLCLPKSVLHWFMLVLLILMHLLTIIRKSQYFFANIKGIAEMFAFEATKYTTLGCRPMSIAHTKFYQVVFIPYLLP